MHTFFNFSSASKVSHNSGLQVTFVEKVGNKYESFQEKSRNVMINSRVSRVIYPLEMYFSLRSNPTVS